MIRYIFLFSSFFFTGLSLLGQNCLLWEVKNPNREGVSYLYGTMHVSNKVAFHLSDAFFDALLSTDYVALETNPEDWFSYFQDQSLRRVGGSNQSQGFYKEFIPEPLDRMGLRRVFIPNTQFLNGFLYRNNPYMQDYQEDTFLDLFIYQVGKRTHREIISLENLEEADHLMSLGSIYNSDFEPEPWAKKMVSEVPYGLLQENSYRDRNLAKLDSLNKGFNSELALDHMLYQRNENMIVAMDSIMKKGRTLFAAVGAAHLPGEQGMLQMLRDQGYEVKPVFSDYTEKGKAKKEELEKKFLSESFKTQTTSDGMISLPSPVALQTHSFRLESMNVALDIANGGFIVITRSPRLDFLNTKDLIGIETIDSLLFENIPGTILSKKRLLVDGHPALDIKNETKSGDRQHYQIILTPLEIINIGFLAKGDYVARNEDKIFPHIKIKPLSDKWVESKTLKGGIALKIPEFNSIDNNSEELVGLDYRNIQAYDKKSQTSFYIMERIRHDVYVVEESEFEHRRIHFNVAKSLESDTINSVYNETEHSMESRFKLKNGKTIRQRSIIDGGHYYLLLSDESKEQKDDVVESAQATAYNYFKDRKPYVDSTLLFEAKVPIEPTPSRFDFPKRRYRYQKKDKTNYFERSFYSRTFGAESGQRIDVDYIKRSKYEYLPGIDSVWQEIRTSVINDSLELYKENISKKAGFDVMDVYVRKKGSNQAIKARYLNQGQRFYKIKTLVNKEYKDDDPFIEDFYSSFVPSDTLLGLAIDEPKAPYFFKDVYSEHDSIRYSALESMGWLEFRAEDYDQLVELLQNFEFRDEELGARKRLIAGFGDFEHPKKLPFLKQYYIQNRRNSALQIEILEALATEENNESIHHVLDLLHTDLPLSTDNFRLNSFFNSLEEKPDASAKILSGLYEYINVPEYEDNILRLTQVILDSTAYKPQKLRKHIPTLVSRAKLEMKRAFSKWNQSKENTSDYYYGRYQKNHFGNLLDYASILVHFSNHKAVKAFFKEIKDIDHPDIHLFLAEYQLRQNEKIDAKLIDTLAEDLEQRYHLYLLLKERNALNLMPAKYDDKAIAMSAYVIDSNLDLESDSVVFHAYKLASYKKEKKDVFYFKVLRDKEEDNKNWQIDAIAFDHDPEEGINFEELYSTRPVDFYDEEDLKEIMDEISDDFLFRDRRRYLKDYRRGGAYPHLM